MGIVNSSDLQFSLSMNVSEQERLQILADKNQPTEITDNIFENGVLIKNSETI